MNSFQQNVIKHKVGLLNLAVELGNVSRACKVMGLSRDTFYRYQSAMETGGVDALIDANRRKPNPKNRVEEATELAVAAFALEQPPSVRYGYPMSCASAASLFPLPAFDPFDCGVISNRSRNVCWP